MSIYGDFSNNSYIYVVQKLKSSLSFCLLLIFLFPFVEKELHHFSHFIEVHCTITDKHFDPLEHHCTICDFANDVSGTPTIFHVDLLIGEIKNIDFSFNENFTLQHKIVFRALRAPPVLS